MFNQMGADMHFFNALLSDACQSFHNCPTHSTVRNELIAGDGHQEGSNFSSNAPPPLVGDIYTHRCEGPALLSLKSMHIPTHVPRRLLCEHSSTQPTVCSAAYHAPFFPAGASIAVSQTAATPQDR